MSHPLAGYSPTAQRRLLVALLAMGYAVGAVGSDRTERWTNAPAPRGAAGSGTVACSRSPHRTHVADSAAAESPGDDDTVGSATGGDESPAGPALLASFWNTAPRRRRAELLPWPPQAVARGVMAAPPDVRPPIPMRTAA